MTTRQELNPYVMLNLFQHLVCFFLLSADASRFRVATTFIPVHSVSSRNDRTGFSGAISNKKGVTLMELVVVFVIIAIGAVLLVPNIGGWLPSYRLRSATRDIASTMRTAQMKAVSTNMEYRVFFPDASSYVLQRNSGGFITEGVPQTIPSGISVDLSTLPGNN